MQLLVVLIVLGWLLSLPWTVILLLIMLAARCYVALRQPGNIGSPIGNNRTAIDHHYVTALEAMVAEGETQMETLRGEIDRIRSAAAASEPDPKAALYGRVGLSSCAPDWLILAARRAYRAQLHPDRHPEHHKWEADRRFKLAEATFDEIASSRS